MQTRLLYLFYVPHQYITLTRMLCRWIRRWEFSNYPSQSLFGRLMVQEVKREAEAIDTHRTSFIFEITLDIRKETPFQFWIMQSNGLGVTAGRRRFLNSRFNFLLSNKRRSFCEVTQCEFLTDGDVMKLRLFITNSSRFRTACFMLLSFVSYHVSFALHSYSRNILCFY